MKLKKPFFFLKRLPEKLNNFFKQNSKIHLKVKNKSKQKGRFNPVTNFDKAFEKKIRKLINKSFPKDGIIGEEFKKKKSLNDNEWSVDPIDGTKAFVKSIPTWSNLIGLKFKNVSIIGLANFPELNRYYINDSKKSYLYTNKKKFVIKTKNKKDFKKIKIIGNFHYDLNYKKNQNLISKLKKNINILTLDALSYCFLAEGKIDAVIETNLKPYDIIPLIPIIKKAGGVITTWANEPAENGGNILATSNSNLHKKILKVIRRS